MIQYRSDNRISGLHSGYITERGDYIVTNDYGENFQECAMDITAAIESLSGYRISNNKAFNMAKNFLIQSEENPGVPISTYQMGGFDIVYYFIIYNG